MHLVPFEPIHHTVTSSTLLDLCMVDDSDKLISFNQRGMDFLSAHDLIEIKYNITVTRCTAKTITIRDYSTFNANNFYEDLASLDWNAVLQADDIDKKVSLLNSNLLLCYDKHEPLKTIHPKRVPAPWITLNIKAQMVERDTLRRRWRRHRTETNYNSYKLIRNVVRERVRAAKERYHLKTFYDLKKPSETWRKLRQLGLIKSRSNDRILPFSVNELNDFFISHIQTDVAEVVEQVYLGEPSYEEFQFYWSNIESSNVRNAFSRITSKAVGDDGISLDLIGLVLQRTLLIITHIFDYSLTSGVFSAAWKSAIVCPIPKTRWPSELKHFRPISIINILSKMLEHVVAEQMMEYLESRKLLDSFQNAYRKNHSTQTALIRVLDDVRQAADMRKVTISVFFDFTKAFDNVIYNRLIEKLRLINFSSSLNLLLSLRKKSGCT
ncbi:uncharacterized protein LOC109861772 [Pseudomyrmex gracilis]|uniref:uncharacterized protein LOC109861772 n=1 Tax=Pseudomyrmex gracilis TaxID=219809 RepID=UPI0009958872|nr:uncharacterized protein LOC109861772 [Pseudomyrmex gracilis]